MPGGRSAAFEQNVLTEALRRTRGAFLVIAAFSCWVNLLVLAAPIYMLQVYDRVLSSYKVETLIMLTVMLAAAFGAWAALDGLRMGIAVRLGGWLTQHMGPFYLDAGVRGRMAGETGGTKSFRDLAKVQSFISAQGMNALFDAPWAPIFIAVIWLLHPWLGIFALCSALLLLSLSVLNAVLTKGPLGRAEDLEDKTMRTAESTVRNAETVSAMGMLPTMATRWRRQNLEADAELRVGSRRSGIVGSVVKFFRSFLQSAILGLGAYLVIRHELTPGTMIAGSILLGRALAPVDQAISTWKSFDSARHAYKRLKTQAEDYPPLPRRVAMPQPRGGLEVEGLNVAVGDRMVIYDVSFEVPPGEAVAVIGPSAAGKSTLCKAIVQTLEAEAGCIRLDGVDMTLWNREELGPFIGYLPQDGGLFPGTVRENISRMQEAPDAMVLEAAKLAHAHEMIAKLPEGYETPLGEGGLGLSGGQKQRVGLARAIFGVPPLIVLDEPNANLDQAGEAALAESILELKKRGCTLMIVGHRPSTIAQADKVLLLNDGQVQAFGPRNEVLERMREVTRPRPAAESASAAAPEADAPDEGQGTPARIGPHPAPTDAAAREEGQVTR